MDELTVLTWRLPRVDASGLEAVTLPEQDRVATLRALREAAGARELAYIPTCQRVVVTLLDAGPDAGERVRDAYAELLGRDVAPAETFRARDAFRHLGETASSLDSLVIGEPQILGQFKDAVQRSDEAGLSGPGLRHVFGLVFRAAKAVRTETDLFRGKVSLVPLTEELVERHLAGKASVRALVLGTGQIGMRAAQMLREKRPDIELHLASRDPARARAASDALGATPRTLADVLADAGPTEAFDVVACAMSTEAPILDAKRLAALARAREVLVLDLAVPRNTAAPASATAGLSLVQIDDLTRATLAQKAKRAQEIEPARRILDVELDRIETTYEQRKLAHDLARLNERFEEVARDRLAAAPGPDDDPLAFDKWYAQTVRALLHEATTAVKQAGCPPTK